MSAFCLPAAACATLTPPAAAARLDYLSPASASPSTCLNLLHARRIPHYTYHPALVACPGCAAANHAGVWRAR